MNGMDTQEIASRMQVIRSWTDQRLAMELRDPKRYSLGLDVYGLLVVEAMARLLEQPK
jgi:hypothetical protein